MRVYVCMCVRVCVTAKGLVQAGHRVRLATHINFKNFVSENGIEFYPLKGLPVCSFVFVRDCLVQATWHFASFALFL